MKTTIKPREDNINTFADFVEQVKAAGLYDAYYSGTCVFIKVADGKIVDSQVFTMAMNDETLKKLKEASRNG